MKRYLLFDSGCCQCSKIAKAIEQEAGGKLTIRSLRDPAVKELLDREHPGWNWEPMLVEEKDDQVRVYAGGAMSRRLVWVLGPRRALRILKIITSKGVQEPVSPQDAGRRNFFRTAGALAIGAVVLMTTSGISHADDDSGTPRPHQGNIYKNEVGLAAWSLGIRHYQVIERKGKMVIVQFSGVSRPPKGRIRIEQISGDGDIATWISYDDRTVELKWSPTRGEMTIISGKDYAHLVFDWKDHKWNADDELQIEIARSYANEVKMIGAILSDTFMALPQSSATDISQKEGQSDSINGICGGDWTYANGWGYTRAAACYQATQNVNNKCSNQYCWGCYQVLPCSCGCAPDTDFFCFCVADGQYCEDCPW